ncbi:MAG TPA: DEAD/DEAH box helicase [Sphaerochaeta sp.]|nr:DEAD/DEAH box helicase [Sphaerochaeta sp.]
MSEQVLKGVEAAGFVTCTDVQADVLPISLTGRDVMVQSKTGSGKTAIFVLTILEAIVKAQKAGKSTPKALIIAPTRELAVQIEEDAILLASKMRDVSIGCFFGGVGYEKQNEILKKGCDIFVATPGRILDYQKMGKVDFRHFDIFVVDEADRLFDMGFYPDIQRMFSLLRPCTERQTMLFSATLSTRVRNLAWSFMNEPAEIEVAPEEITVKKISQELYHVAKSDKFQLFLYLLQQRNPENCLVFANTKARCIEVSKRLSLNGYQARYLMGDLPQSQRLQTIDRMKDGKLNFLVATDVAARGLQIDDLEMVVNYDLPDDYESYVHRIGRTARAGKSGTSISLADEEYVFNLEAIEEFIQMKIPVIWPNEEAVKAIEDKSAHKSFRDLVRQDEYRSGGRRRPGGRPPQRSGGRGRSGQQRPRQRQASGPRPQPKRGDAKRQSRPPRQQQDTQQRRDKSYAQIQALSLDERLAYYKQQYQAEQGDGKPAARGTQKPRQEQRPARDAQKPRQEQRKRSSEPGKKPRGRAQEAPAIQQRAKQTADAKATTAPAEKQQGNVFTRLFSRRKK